MSDLMHSAIRLQTAQPEDEDFLAQVYASSREEELAQVAWNDHQKAAFLKSQHEAQHHHYRAYYPNADFDLILLDGERIGRIYVDRRIEEIRLMDIALLPEFRNRGIGTKLIRDLMDEATRSQKFIGLHVEQFNRAYQLYTRFGFQDVEMRGIYMFMTWTASKEEKNDAR